MKKYIYFLLLSILVFSTGCLKSLYEDGETYVITGTIYQDCAQLLPLAHKDLYLYDTGQKEVLAHFTTDALGHFSVNYQLVYNSPLFGNAPFVEIRGNTGVSFATISVLPKSENMEDISIVNNAQSNIEIKLNINNTYTESDTIYYRVLSNQTGYEGIGGLGGSIVGPFTSNEVVDIIQTRAEYFGGGTIPANLRLIWGLGGVDFMRAWDDTDDIYNSIPFTITDCNTSTVTIDLEAPE